MTPVQLAALIAAEIACRAEQVSAAITLIDGGATVPFIARYRKEATGGLDDTQLRTLEERLSYLRELEIRRTAILGSIEEQGKLTADLAQKIGKAATKAELEDLYLPYRQKRKTRADTARENGLGPLARSLLADRRLDPAEAAKAFVTDKVADVKAALEGARDILSEEFAENAELVGRIRLHMQRKAMLRARVVPGKENDGAKFSDYFDHTERWADAPSHRVLALLRAREEGIVTLELEVDEADPAPVKPVEMMVAHPYNIRASGGTAADTWLMGVAKWAWRAKISTHLSIDLMATIRERAEEEAIRVFARNLKDLLLAAPAGAKVTMGLDPGIRTGVKVAVVDRTGKLVATATVYPFQPRNDVTGAAAALAALIRRHGVELIAIGNGTASRETDRLVLAVLADLPGAKPAKVVVSEAGASVYSASALAAAEMPDLDVSLRGAVSIARRLQDPLAELVKIEPKAVGVGQYQHDVSQNKLARALDAVVEDAVTAVGVDLNTASPALLARVSGVGGSLADAIVVHRNENGPFRKRRELLSVPRLGPKTFEQCAGFLRINDGTEPLDASAVHPEAYPLAKRIVEASGRDVRSLMGDASALRGLSPARFVDERFGLPTVKDIIAELEKPGRDPRPRFQTATFADGIEEIGDLKPGLSLQGVVTNVAAFGAFVDIGVHQDGLVHISELADRRVKEASEVVKVGDVVTVRVIEVDVKRKRIALSMRKEGGRRAGEGINPRAGEANAAPRQAPAKEKGSPPAQGAFGTALAEALKRK